MVSSSCRISCYAAWCMIHYDKQDKIILILLKCLYQVKKVSGPVYVWLMITAIAQCITKKEGKRTITVLWNICLNMSSINIDYSDHTHILGFNVIKNIMSLTAFIWWDTVGWFSNWLCSISAAGIILGKKTSKELRNWKKNNWLNWLPLSKKTFLMCLLLLCIVT